MDDILILEKIKKLPESKKLELIDFADFLLSKVEENPIKKQRKAGFAKGTFTMLLRFDDPIEGLEEYL